MQATQITAERIKLQAKLQGVSAKKVLEICELGPNTITKMSNGSDIVSQSLKKIADYLECSVDYLLGRTEIPTINGDTHFSGENHNGIQATVNTGNLTVNGSTKSDTDTSELVELIQGLPLIKRAEAIIYLNELKTKK